MCVEIRFVTCYLTRGSFPAILKLNSKLSKGASLIILTGHWGHNHQTWHNHIQHRIFTIDLFYYRLLSLNDADWINCFSSSWNATIWKIIFKNFIPLVSLPFSYSNCKINQEELVRFVMITTVKVDDRV